MAGKVVNSSFVLLNNFGVSRQVNASKVATSHIRKPLAASVTDDTTRQRNRNKKQKKQTILTGYKRTGNDIHNRQRVSRHSLPTLLYFLFSPPHIFLIQFYANAQTAHLALTSQKQVYK